MENIRIVYDVETISDINYRGFLRAYSLSYVVSTCEATELIDSQILEVATFTGFDCIERFLEAVFDKYKKGSYIRFITFNGAKFDNFLLADVLQQSDNLKSI